MTGPNVGKEGDVRVHQVPPTCEVSKTDESCQILHHITTNEATARRTETPCWQRSVSKSDELPPPPYQEGWIPPHVVKEQQLVLMWAWWQEKKMLVCTTEFPRTCEGKTDASYQVWGVVGGPYLCPCGIGPIHYNVHPQPYMLTVVPN